MTWRQADTSYVCVEGRSIDLSQLRVRPRASTGVRHVTPIKSQLLYQLSDAGAPVIVFAESSAACRRNHGRPSALLSKLLSNRKTVVKLERAERGKLLSFWTSSRPPSPRLGETPSRPSSK